MAPRSAWILGGATVVSLATATAAAALAARGNPLRLLSSHASYSLGNSVVDVAVYAWLHSIALLILLGAGLRDACHAKKLRVAVRVLCSSSELILLGKAVAVAVMGDEVAWPSAEDPGRSGLVAIFLGLGGPLAGALVQSPSACRLLRRSAARRSSAAAASLSAAAACDLAAPLVVRVGSDEGDSDAESEDGISTPRPGGKRETSKTALRLLGMASPDVWIIAAAFAFGSVAALGQALIPYYSGRVIDLASIDPDRLQFELTVVRLLCVTILCAIATGFRGALFTVCMTRLNVRLRTQLFESLMVQETGFYDRVRIGDLSSRLSADATAAANQITLNLNVLLRTTLQAAIVLVFMFSASWRLTIVTFVLVPAVVVLVGKFGKMFHDLAKAIQAELAKANAVAEEALSAHATVVASGAVGSTVAEYRKAMARFAAVNNKEAVVYGFYMTTDTALQAGITALVLWVGGTYVLDKQLSAGALVSFMLYEQSLAGAFETLGDVFSSIASAVGAADKVVQLVDRAPKMPPPGTLSPPGPPRGELALERVEFSYPTRPGVPVLRGLDLVVPEGRVTALVGPSGGGKSSVVKLVLRAYLPSAGRVTLDGVDVGDYDPRWLRRHVALVSQEPVLFARTIRENILYGLTEADGVPADEVPGRAEVEAAARLANAHEFIAALPEGYDTQCGERGVSLSGGQKQRIAIARALVRKPRVLLLDEATSALDADSEALVQEALDASQRGRTVLVIAHRLSTVQHADAIAVIQAGKVVERGTHEALLERGGAYARLVRRQMARGGIAASDSTVDLAPKEPKEHELSIRIEKERTAAETHGERLGAETPPGERVPPHLTEGLDVEKPIKPHDDGP